MTRSATGSGPIAPVMASFFNTSIRIVITKKGATQRMLLLVYYVTAAVYGTRPHVSTASIRVLIGWSGGYVAPCIEKFTNSAILRIIIAEFLNFSRGSLTTDWLNRYRGAKPQRSTMQSIPLRFRSEPMGPTLSARSGAVIGPIGSVGRRVLKWQHWRRWHEATAGAN